MLVWMIALGGVFIYEVSAKVAMPNVDSALLWL